MKIDKIVLLIVFLSFIIGITSIIRTYWSLSSFLGLIFMFMSLYLILINKGKIKIQANSPFVWVTVIGLMFIFLGYANVDLLVFRHPLSTLFGG